jgi:putative chitinase
VNIETLLAAMPGLDRPRATSYLPPMEAAMWEFQISTELRSRMWLAQVGHESVSLRYFEEIASGAAYEGRRDLGNTQPGDGVRFKGRGPIQLTGRANYTSAGNALGLPLVSNPPMAADPRHAFRVSAWWWATHGLNPISDTADVLAATRRINGGTNGLTDRQQRYERCRALGARVILGAAQPPPAPKPPPPPPEDRVAVGTMPDGRHELFIETSSGEILHRWNLPGGGWATWSSLGKPGG